jgi:acyl-CoA synthetase (NDP forming)
VTEGFDSEGKDKEQLPDLEYLFHPQSIAIVGASANPRTMGFGNLILGSMLECEFKGKLYPVHHHAKEIMGLRAYPSIKDIPDGVDYVISCIPAPQTLELIKDCIAKRVKATHIFTAGFSEIGEKGRELERQVVNLARQGGVRIIGPNCMGIYCPSTGLAFEPIFGKESGWVGYLSQSGGHSMELTQNVLSRGIRFSKVISYGNAADLNEADFLEYFTQDSETRIIAVYIEGVKEPQKFFKVFTKAAQAKPVIVFKGGQTEAGLRAVASHTGALAVSELVWDAFCRQAGVVQAHSLDELSDLVVTFSIFKPFKGNRVGIIGVGGGAGVQTADMCSRAGLIVPHFSPQVRQELRKFTPEAGTSVHNPVDNIVPFGSTSTFFKSISVIAASGEVDILLIHIMLAYGVVRRQGEDPIKQIIKASQTFDIPVAVVLHGSIAPDESGLAFKLQQMCAEARLPVYCSVENAARAISKFIQYHQVWRDRKLPEE